MDLVVKTFLCVDFRSTKCTQNLDKIIHLIRSLLSKTDSCVDSVHFVPDPWVRISSTSKAKGRCVKIMVMKLYLSHTP